jgi:hypothetical protein
MLKTPHLCSHVRSNGTLGEFGRTTQLSLLHDVSPAADSNCCQCGGTEMIACYRTLADSGALIIWAARKEGNSAQVAGRSFVVPLTRQLYGKQAVVLFFYHRITLTTAFF